MIVRIRRPHTGAGFIHPLGPATRTAILARGFQETGTVRVFPNGWNERVERFRPTSLAGGVQQLRHAALKNLRLEHTVIAFTYAGQSGLSREDRELFWNAFGVPVFEEFLGPRNELLAMECDAHSGLHVVRGCDDLSLERGACACGSSAPRISRTPRIEELAEMLV
jgi:hypothetical protein